MEGQLPLIDAPDTDAWQLAEHVRKQGLRGVHEARQALEQARRRRIQPATVADPATRRRAA